MQENNTKARHTYQQAGFRQGLYSPTTGGSLYFTRPTLGTYVAAREELLTRAGAVLGAVERGDLRLRIEKTLPLAQAAEAHQLLASRKTTGKLLLVP